MANGGESVWHKVPLVRDNWLAKCTNMISFKQILVIAPLNDDDPPPSTNEDFEPNAADLYCELGDTATAAVLDGIALAIVVVSIYPCPR